MAVAVKLLLPWKKLISLTISALAALPRKEDWSVCSSSDLVACESETVIQDEEGSSCSWDSDRDLLVSGYDIGGELVDRSDRELTFDGEGKACSNQEATQGDGEFQFVGINYHGDEGLLNGEDHGEAGGEWRARWEDEDEDQDEDEEDEEEEIIEDDEMMEMLKAEARKARAAGALPAIAEDSADCLPKLSELPRPPPPPREDPAVSLRQLHRTYRQRMKKLDVLGYQKLSAMGLLELQGISKLSSSGGFWRRQCRCGDAPSESLVKEIRCDLETVYVGQLCLSWEILNWQYLRARDLASASFRKVAGEFLQFHVLIQRFLEDEPFQGPRIPGYARKRSLLRSLLLQVPLLRDDRRKKTTARREDDDDDDPAFSIEELEYVMEDAIRIFWEFIRAEKRQSKGIINGLLAAPPRLQDPADQELAISVRNLLKQKKNEVKEEVRAGTCLVRKLSGRRRSNQDDLFFAQVDVKLVARVLTMSTITRDRLSWCLWKLQKIHYMEKKIRREASFSLFPC
ncbi:uncharacterized protein LOC144701737 isoform X2 [Wolffia australiana]